MLTIPTSLLPSLVAQAPAAVGEIAFSMTVDRAMLSRMNVLDCIRSGMASTTTPAVIMRAVEHEPDQLSPEMPTVASYAPCEGGFTITFVRFPDETETDASS